MNEFIGRKIELKNLNNMYKSDKFEMAVIYGRRRVGKTSLIKQFISNKSAIYVQGVEATAETNLRFLSNTTSTTHTNRLTNLSAFTFTVR